MTNNGRRYARKNNAGVALLTALGALVIFTMLGSAYAFYLATERQQVEIDLHRARARTAAQAGVEAAIGQIAHSLANGQEPAQGNGPVPVTLYRATDDASVAADDSRSVKVEVTVSDEAARINLNYAPTLVLGAILGINPNQAREIRMHLPRVDSDDPSAITKENARWLASIDELRTRGEFGVKPEILEKVNRDLLTVHSGAADSMGGWLNVNTASAEVLAAVLGIPVEQAQQVQQKRPFTNTEQFVAAVGKDPMTYNARPSADAPGALPRELAFGSRCYRIVSHAVVNENGRDKAGNTVEAVVYIDLEGRPEIRSWNQTPGINPAQAS